MLAVFLAAQLANPAMINPAIVAALAAPLAATPPCITPPLQDGSIAVVGTGTPCSTRPDAQRKAVIQISYSTTANDGTFTGPATGDYSFSAQPSYIDAKINSSTTPYLCGIGSWTATTYSGKCFQLVATTLPSVSTALLGLAVSPFSSTAGGLTVRVVARQ